MKRIFTAVALLLSALSYAQQFTAPLRVNSDSSFSDREPWMQVGPNGSIYVSWIKVPTTGPGEAYFTRSDNGGMSFLPAVKATSGAKIPADLQRGAPFTIDTKGNIHMAWVEMRYHSPIDNKMQPDVFYIRSTDNGMTWSTEIVVSDDSSKYAQDFPSLAADSSGNVYLSFLDSRERAQGSSDNEQLYLRKSTDNGSTWSPARRVNQMPGSIGGTCECCKQDIQAGRDGMVTIAFRSNINATTIPENDRRDIFTIRSTNYGDTFSEAVPIQSEQWTIEACPVTGPNSFLSGNGHLNIAWRDARDVANKVSHVYTAEQTDLGEPTTFNLLLDEQGETMPNWPDIAVYESTTAIVYETNNRGLQYILRSAQFGSPNLKSQVLFAGNRQQFGNIAIAANGDRYIVWQEDRFATNDIFFVKDTLPLNSGAVRTKSTSGLSTVPNPVRGGDRLNITLTENAAFDTYELVDILGKVVVKGKLVIEESGATVTIPVVPNGSYLMRLLSADSYVTQMIVIAN